MRRSNLLRQLTAGPLDVLILGGGINGAGVVRDLALRAHLSGRPLRLGLAERHGFASGTSGKNSQLIHGGLRYLKYLEFRLVREALRERATLLEIAPHLVHVQPFLIPMYSHFERLYYGAGLSLYDYLAGKRNISPHRRIPAGQVINLEPGLLRDSLVESAIFFDGRVHSARYVLENLQEARSHGAVTLNYCAAVGWTRNTEGFWEVRLRDELDGAEATCRARKLVNTTGAWQSSAEGRLRLVRGSHLILPRVTSSENAIAYFEPAGRIIFFIPWGERNDLTLLGTTDVDHPGGADDVRISAEEVRYLLDIAATLFPKSRSLQPVSAYSSLRPLLDDGSGSATSTSREHRIWNDAQGILHVAGGKYTTYRAMSEEAVDQIAAEIAPHLEAIHATATTPLNGNSRQNVQAVQDDLPPEWRALLLPYGTGAARIVRRLGSVREEGGLEALERARILEAIETDQAETLADLVFTSTYWGYERTWTAAALLPYAEAMADHLAWPAGRAGAEVRRVLDQVALPDLAGKT